MSAQTLKYGLYSCDNYDKIRELADKHYRHKRYDVGRDVNKFKILKLIRNGVL